MRWIPDFAGTVPVGQRQLSIVHILRHICIVLMKILHVTYVLQTSLAVNFVRDRMLRIREFEDRRRSRHRDLILSNFLFFNVEVQKEKLQLKGFDTPYCTQTVI